MRFSVVIALLGALAAGAARAGEPLTACGARDGLVSIYVGGFEGDAHLAQRVRAIVAMQLLASLRPSDPARPGVDFGHGCVERDEPGAPKVSLLTLYGSVRTLGSDAVLRTTLERIVRNDRRKTAPEKWRIRYNGREIAQDIVASKYVFTLSNVRNDALNKYTTLSKIKFCRTPRLPCNDGELGFESIAATDSIPDFVHAVVGRRRVGWLYLPSISDEIDAIDFSAAVVRILRGDFGGADSLLTRVAQSSADAGVRVNALLLLASLSEMSGRAGDAFLVQAKAINPTLRSVFQTDVMMSFAKLSRGAAGEEKQKLEKHVADTLAAASALFEPDDPWLKAARAVSGG